MHGDAVADARKRLLTTVPNAQRKLSLAGNLFTYALRRNVPLPMHQKQVNETDFDPFLMHIKIAHELQIEHNTLTAREIEHTVIRGGSLINIQLSPASLRSCGMRKLAQCVTWGTCGNEL